VFVSDWVSLPTMLAYQWQHSPIQTLPYMLPLVLFTALAGLLVADIVSTVKQRTPDSSALGRQRGPGVGGGPLAEHFFPGSPFDDLALVTVAMVFVAAAFYSCRNTQLAVIAVSIPLTHHLGFVRGLSWRLGSRSEYVADRAPNPVLLASSAVLLGVAGGLFSNRLMTWEPVPRGAVEFMTSHRLHGNILNNFDWGEYLVWHLAPESRVFVDGRCELVYPDSILAEYLGFLYDRPGGEKLLDRYPHDFVLVKLRTGAYRLVSTDSRWKEIYRDSFSALFARAGAYMPSLMGADSAFPMVAQRTIDPARIDSTFP
jgi:hypothetical protein